MKLPKIKFSLPAPSERVQKFVTRFMFVFIILAFSLNIFSAATGDNIESLRFVGIMGWGMAIVWYLMFYMADRTNDSLRKMLSELLDMTKPMFSVFDKILAEYKKDDEASANKMKADADKLAKDDAVNGKNDEKLTKPDEKSVDAVKKTRKPRKSTSKNT